jgi:D-cysteine desulfhydrase
MIHAAAISNSSLTLFRRFPALGAVPRAPLGRFPTPVESAEAIAPGLWVKRDDLAAEPLGGNKVRALEFLLGGVQRGDHVTTVGATGSTHVLATAVYARLLGAQSVVYRWPQEMNDVARRVAQRIVETADETPLVHDVAVAYARAFVARLRGARWVPAGGSSPRGVLGQVNAGLELAAQVAAGVLPAPCRIVVPVGTGGTVAGLALGLTIAGLACEIIGVRVVPRLVANEFRVRRLIARTARLLERLTSERVPRRSGVEVLIRHDFYGGAYGRPIAAGDAASQRFADRQRLTVDATYGAKALAAAMALAEQRGGTTLFWLSFDGRWLGGDGDTVGQDLVALA